MIWNQIKDNWKEVCDKIKLTWGKLSEDDLTRQGLRPVGAAAPRARTRSRWSLKLDSNAITSGM